MKTNKIKILFFIGTLSSGGKERRLLELMTYLNWSERFSLFLVTKQTDVMFENFYKLNVEWIPLSTAKLSIRSFLEFYKIVKRVSPDIIHSWGSKQTLISLFPKIALGGIKLVNSQITSAPPRLSFMERLISQVNFRFSEKILSNSFAGVTSYSPPQSKTEVIYNGLNFNRFANLSEQQVVRKKYGIETRFALIMVATYSENKDYERFFRVGRALLDLRQDTTFIGIGYYVGDEVFFKNALAICNGFNQLKPLPGTFQVEALINACDIGVLFSNTRVHGEGISNAIIEYMALGKPVVANDAGGTREIVKDNQNGILIKDESPEEIAGKINRLLDDEELMQQMGRRSRERILKDFSLEKMGSEFERVYLDLLK